MVFNIERSIKIQRYVRKQGQKPKVAFEDLKNRESEKQMGYGRINGPTKWRIEPLHATKKLYCIRIFVFSVLETVDRGAWVFCHIIYSSVFYRVTPYIEFHSDKDNFMISCLNQDWKRVHWSDTLLNMCARTHPRKDNKSRGVITDGVVFVPPTSK